MLTVFKSKTKFQMNDYQKSFDINKPESEVNSALTEHISDWWSDDLTGSAKSSGDRFTISFGKTRKTMDVVSAVPDKQIIWKCVEAYIDMPSLKNKSEWVGTKLIWTLTTSDQHTTTLTFLHEGLNQNFECYEVCESAWNTFLASLKSYLTTGKGEPNRRKVEVES
jgi:hypothetical protein